MESAEGNESDNFYPTKRLPARLFFWQGQSLSERKRFIKSADRQNPRQIGRFTKWLAVIFLMLGAAFFLFSRWADHMEIPTELREVSPEYRVQSKAADVQAMFRKAREEGRPEAITGSWQILHEAMRNAGPDDPYKKLINDMRQAKTHATFRDLFVNNRGFLEFKGRESEAVKAQRNDWLARNRAYLNAICDAIERLQRNTDSTPTLRAQSARPYFEQIGLLSYTNHEMLIVDGWKRLREEDIEGARRISLALLKLNELELTQYGLVEKESFLSIPGLMDSVELLFACVNGQDMPSSRISVLQTQLDEISGRIFQQENLQNVLKREYARQRDQVTSFASRESWRSQFFGWDVDSRFRHYFIDVDFLGLEMTLPRVRPLASTTFRAISMKRRVSENLRSFDGVWQKFIEQSKLPYSEFRAQPFGIPPVSAIGGMHHNLPHRSLVRDWVLAETQFNLVRAALDWQSHSMPPLADSNSILPLDHPWRDPFTGKSFRVNQGNANLVIYSPGPDLQDQLGNIEYSISESKVRIEPEQAGDILIHARLSPSADGSR